VRCSHTPSAISGSAVQNARPGRSPTTPNATTTPTNGAVEKYALARATPSSRNETMKNMRLTP
jgi:hypothetical protein